MASDRVTVGRFRGLDCWRTWFLEECEAAALFGMAERHRLWFKYYCREGTRLYFEDAPYFRLPGATHRIFGPFEVVVANTPDDAEPEIRVCGVTVVYREAHPQRGPWRDRRGVLGIWGRQRLTYDQNASEYDYFPFRFGIRRAASCGESLVAHGPACRTFCAD